MLKHECKIKKTGIYTYTEKELDKSRSLSLTVHFHRNIILCLSSTLQGSVYLPWIFVDWCMGQDIVKYTTEFFFLMIKK